MLIFNTCAPGHMPTMHSLSCTKPTCILHIFTASTSIALCRIWAIHAHHEPHHDSAVSRLLTHPQHTHAHTHTRSLMGDKDSLEKLKAPGLVAKSVRADLGLDNSLTRTLTHLHTHLCCRP